MQKKLENKLLSQIEKLTNEIEDLQKNLESETILFDARKTSNGKMNKAVRGTITKEETENLFFVVWDLIELKDWESGFSAVTCEQRFKKLQNMLLENHSKKFEIIESNTVSSIELGLMICQKYIDSGFEGGMFKNMNAPWQAKRTTDILKVKSEKTIDLLCVGYKQHTKNENMIGALECVDGSGNLNVFLGTGLTEDDRLKKPEEYVGKILEVVYNDIIKSKDKKTVSLFLPVFKSIRLDKTTPDSI